MAVCAGKIKIALGFQPQFGIKLPCTWTAISEGIFLWTVHSEKSAKIWHFITKFKFQSSVFFRVLISSGSELLAFPGPMAAHTTDIPHALHFRVLCTLWQSANQQDFPSLSCFFFRLSPCWEEFHTPGPGTRVEHRLFWLCSSTIQRGSTWL